LGVPITNLAQDLTSVLLRVYKQLLLPQLPRKEVDAIVRRLVASKCIVNAFRLVKYVLINAIAVIARIVTYNHRL